jgi:hypothetical protein
VKQVRVALRIADPFPCGFDPLQYAGFAGALGPSSITAPVYPRGCTWHYPPAMSIHVYAAAERLRACGFTVTVST